MSTNCLSLPTNLRCESLTQTQSIVFLIPPVLEILFSVGLVVSRWNTGVQHLFLAAEGFAYLTLAVLDFLAHLLPEAREDLEVFKVLDIIVGTASLIPLLLYIGFLTAFTISKMIPNLPQRGRTITKYILILFIPVLAALNGISSLAGISYRVLTSPNSLPTLAVGFADPEAQSEWTFFSGIALALLVVTQALNFCVTFYQLVNAYVSQRQIEANNRKDDEIHRVKGVGWMALGIKLGAVESVVGFAMFGNGGFTIAMTRRIIRLFGRACLVIGVVKGIDEVEDFNILPPGRARPPSRLQISNPRLSTFRRLSRGVFDTVLTSPTDSAREQIIRSDREAYQHFGKVDGEKVPFPSRSRRSSWVTVRQDPETAPAIDIRFSALRMPSMPMPSAETINHATQARPGRVSRYSFGGTPINGTPRSTPQANTSPSLPSPTFGPPSPALQPPPRAILPASTPPRPFIPFGGPDGSRSDITSASTSTITPGRYNRADNAYLNPSGPRDSVMSASSIASDSLEVVRQISSQFPGLPPRVTGKYRGSILGQRGPPEEPWIARTVRPQHDTLASVPEEASDRSYSQVLSVGTGKRKPAPIPSPISPGITVSRAYDDGYESATVSPNQDTSLKRTTSDSGGQTVRTYDTRGSRLDMPWLENDTNAEIIVEGRAELEEAWWKTEAGMGLKRSPVPPGTPTMGQVRSRTTPTATTSSFARTSEYVLHEDLPHFSVVGSQEAVRPGSPIRDSQVLATV